MVCQASPHRSSGPDGFNAHFFKVCWPIIGADVSTAIQDFFIHGKLLKQIKHTFITLIPKNDYASSPADFRPNSLTNEICKIISRIVAARIKPLMSKLINHNQSAFILGRNITDNILSHDLFRNIHLNKGEARMPLKINYSKDFDMVNWNS